MSEPRPVPSALRRGIAAVSAVPECTAVHAATFDTQHERWVIALTLDIDQPGDFVEKSTRWCVLVDHAYPMGVVEFYPAIQGGLTATFPHQERNQPWPTERAWRSGKLCLDTAFRGEFRSTEERDPVGDAEGRLRWYVERAVLWLGAAATGRLLAPGEPFEVPARPKPVPVDWASRRVVHDETAGYWSAWAGCIGKAGVVRFSKLPGISTALAAASFEDWNKRQIRSWTGRPVEPSASEIPGIWWLWSDTIVLPPWQAPATWGELRRIGDLCGVDVDSTLRHASASLRRTKGPGILMLGYPIAAHVGDPPREVHWEAVLVPELTAPSGKPPNGFRRNGLGWWHRDRYGPLADAKPLRYLHVENWSEERLRARGRLPASLIEARAAILGLGALGGLLAEHLVRAGLKDLTLIDGEPIVAGNITRHVATLEDVGEDKVRVMARRLRAISPAIRVTEVAVRLPEDAETVSSTLEPFDVVIDCTASDRVLAALTAGWWSVPRTMVSFSLGFAGRRLFSFGVTAHQFPREAMERSLTPWLADETKAWAEHGEVLEGAGCWSPLFPARVDDVALMAAVCVSELETLVAGLSLTPRFRVFERSQSADGFAGIVPLDQPPSTAVKS